MLHLTFQELFRMTFQIPGWKKHHVMRHNASHSAPLPCMLTIPSLTQKDLYRFNSPSVSTQWTTIPCSSIATNCLYCFHLPIFVSRTPALCHTHHSQTSLCQFTRATVPLAHQHAPTEKLLSVAQKQQLKKILVTRTQHLKMWIRTS